MQRNKKEKKLRREQKVAQKKNFKFTVTPKENPQKKVTIFGKSIKWILFYIGGSVALISGAFTVFDYWKQIRYENLPAREKYEVKNFDTGHLVGTPVVFENYVPETIPIISNSPVLDTFPIIKGLLIENINKTGMSIQVGTNTVHLPAVAFYNGIDVFKDQFNYCTTSKIFLGVKENRLYISVVFKDFITRQFIGVVEFNKWKVFTPNLLTYKYDDQRFEVLDRQFHIVFSIKYKKSVDEYGPTVIINGYFMSPKNILVLNSTGIGATCYSYEKNNSQFSIDAALENIENIKSIF